MSIFSPADYNPSYEFIDHLRTGNVVIGFVVCFVLLAALAWPRWATWSVSTRLGWMALFFLCLTATYGTFEVKYLHTYFRVPMVTVSMLWAIIAALWPYYEQYKAYRKALKQDRAEEPR